MFNTRLLSGGGTYTRCPLSYHGTRVFVPEGILLMAPAHPHLAPSLHGQARARFQDLNNESLDDEIKSFRRALDDCTRRFLQDISKKGPQ